MNAPGPVPTTWTTGTTEVFHTGTWRAALPRHIQAPSPCHAACPVDGDIAEWIGQARAGDLRGAWDTLTRHNPFPAITGRVCHHPCEGACNRKSLDGAVSICRLERFVGDHALAERWSFASPEPGDAESIAVVGGGPAGLSAAFHLRRLGYRVTIFEAREQLGGLMRYGIPPYRLPRAVLDAEIGRIVAMGVEVRCGEALTSSADLARWREAFDAVFLATGACRPKRLALLDYAQPWILDAADYLARANAGAPPKVGHRMLVIGGGSAALDVARSGRRAGHEVTVVALERVDQMPAQPEEIAEALEEGVAIVDGAMLTSVVPSEGGLGVACVRVRFDPGEVRGQFTVAPLPGTDFSLEADAIVSAIGQDPDLGTMPGIGTAGPLLEVDRDQSTSAMRVYAGGDIATLARFVTEAIGAGKRAALAIHRELRAMPAAAAPTESIVQSAAINTFYHPGRARVPEHTRAVAARLANAVEVQIALDAALALGEAERCFSCGTCIECDNCVHYCPDLAVAREDGRYVVRADYCKGCGLCVRECPTGSMKMVAEAR